MKLIGSSLLKIDTIFEYRSRKNWENRLVKILNLRTSQESSAKNNINVPEPFQTEIELKLISASG